MCGRSRYGGVRRVPTHSRGPARDVTRSPHRLDYTLSVEYRAGPRSVRRQDFRREKMVKKWLLAFWFSGGPLTRTGPGHADMSAELRCRDALQDLIDLHHVQGRHDSHSPYRFTRVTVSLLLIVHEQRSARFGMLSMQKVLYCFWRVICGNPRRGEALSRD